MLTAGTFREFALPAAVRLYRCLPRLFAAVLGLFSGFTADAVTPTTVAVGLRHPWALAFLPDGSFLVSERVGALRVVQADGRVGPPLAGVPPVVASGQGGLLDVILDADFGRNRRVYFCFSQAVAGGNSTALASAVLADDASRLNAVRVIFTQQPAVDSRLHFGCRIVESRDRNGQADGLLYLTLGERYHWRQDAQTLDNHHGKVIRIGKDGSVPRDNPFVGRRDALPEIWSFGHRNPQGAALSPLGVLWLHEHGPMGGDEINLPVAGANFGWPLVSFGRNYDFTAVGDGGSERSGVTPPVHYWTPSIAPSGMAFVTSTRYGADWVGNLLVGSLKLTHLARLELTQPYAGKVRRETRLLTALGERIRDVRQGPDGLIYLLTDSAEGRLIRLDP